MTIYFIGLSFFLSLFFINMYIYNVQNDTACMLVWYVADCFCVVKFYYSFPTLVCCLFACCLVVVVVVVVVMVVADGICSFFFVLFLVICLLLLF